MSPTTHNEADLIAGLLAGEPQVIQQVRVWLRAGFGPYRARLAADLDDLEQEILLELTQALREGRFRGRSRLRTYVRTYVHHKCIDRLRALERRQWLDVDQLELTSRDPSPLEQLSRAESTALAWRVVEEMPESCRELWRMLEQGMKYRDMSRRLGIAEGTLRARVLRCRKRALEARSRLLAKMTGNETRGATTK